MLKWTPVFFLLILLLYPITISAGSLYGDGAVDNSSGLENKDLRYEGFNVNPDGYVTGYIVNTSNRPVKAVRLDMWLTNANETQILWRKSLNIGDMAPGAKYPVKEAYNPGMEDPAKIKFKFRMPSGSNYRNSSAR